jgi:hypothetical protein
MAACEAYQPTDAIADYLKHQRRILSTLGAACYHKLQTSGIDVHETQGGFYLFLDFSNLQGAGISTSEALCEKLLADTGVALLPGTAFGMEPHHLSARLAYVDFDGAKTLEASKEVGLQHHLGPAYARDHFPKTLEGIDKICEWVTGLAPVQRALDETASYRRVEQTSESLPRPSAPNLSAAEGGRRLPEG